MELKVTTTYEAEDCLARSHMSKIRAQFSSVFISSVALSVHNKIESKHDIGAQHSNSLLLLLLLSPENTLLAVRAKKRTRAFCSACHAPVSLLIPPCPTMWSIRE